MNCHECAIEGEAVPAVATCRHCGAGLCLEDLQKALDYRVGGTLFGCSHRTTTASRLGLALS
jgi:hypothetical protein